MSVYQKFFPKISVLLLPVLLIAGCAPGLGTTFEVTYIPSVQIESSDLLSLQKLEGLPFKVGTFTDDRSDQSSVQIDGRKVLVKGTLPLLAQDSVREVLKLSKTENCTNDCITISGSIKEWSMKVTPDFPTSTAKANVQIEVEFTFSDGYSIAGLPSKLTGKSSGSSNKQHPLMDESDMTDVFGEALNEAVIGSMLQLVKQM
jgi:hypothetical protein